jgi:hypothetical protein
LSDPGQPLTQAQREELFRQTLLRLDDAFHDLAQRVPPPVLVRLGAGEHFRCQEKTAAQAVIQKLSRIVSGVRALRVLLTAGLYQEAGAIVRILDEVGEDVVFLSEAVRTGDLTPRHQEMLDYFFAEEFDQPDNPLASTQRRPTIRREKIQSAIAGLPHQPVNASDSRELQRTMFHAMSGFVHPTSVHVLDSYGGAPPHFHLQGMRGTPREVQWEAQGVHYLYRGLTWVMYVAKAFGAEELVGALYVYRERFETQAQMTHWPDPDQRVRDLRQGRADSTAAPPGKAS